MGGAVSYDTIVARGRGDRRQRCWYLDACPVLRCRSFSCGKASLCNPGLAFIDFCLKSVVMYLPASFLCATKIQRGFWNIQAALQVDRPPQAFQSATEYGR